MALPGSGAKTQLNPRVDSMSLELQGMEEEGKTTLFHELLFCEKTTLYFTVS